MNTSSLLTPGLALGLLLAAPAAPASPPAAAPQTWYDAEADYRSLPPTASEMHALLAPVDLAAAQRLAIETSGGRVAEARFVGGEEPACEVRVYTEERQLLLRTDPAGTRVLSQEEVARIPGWPMEGDWIELPSGLKYYDVEVGDGTEPRNSVVLVTTEYAGYLVDGTCFQSTADLGRPMVSPLSGGIPGWKEGLLSMKTGGRRKLLIPPELGYGPAGYGCQVPPDATLVFDVELLKWKR